MKEFDVLVIGAGGAGMFCAAQASQRWKSVAILDHAPKIGRKILISGGGRCNFTNLYADPTCFVSENPHFCKSALKRYTPDDFINLVKSYRIPFHEKKLGQLFCDGSADNIVNLLISECEKGGAEFYLNCRIESVEQKDGFVIRTSRGDFKGESLVVATGGLSIPQIGATGFGYDIARQFGLKIVDTAPALDGFTFSDVDTRGFSELSGLSLDTVLTCNEASFRENILFTHAGLSGPASLQGSLYWKKGDEVSINLLPEEDANEWLKSLKQQGTKMDLKNLLAQKLPKRFAEKFCDMRGGDAKLSSFGEKDIAQLADLLANWKLKPKGTVGYKKAEVTRGGVDTDCLSSKTMEAKTVKGLYFIGEVVDVTGRLGGFNFQWAWSSGFAAGQAV